jgi:putative ABC transport system permease protein
MQALSLAFRNVVRQRMRSGMTLAAIVVGVAALVISGGFVRDVLFQLGEALIHSQSGHLQVARAGYFSFGSRAPDKFALLNVEHLRNVIRGMPGVDDVMGRLSFSGLLNNGKTDWPIIGEGVEPAKEAKLGSFMQITAGRQLLDKDRFGVLIGQGVSSALNVYPGDRVTIVTNTSAGALNTLDFEIVGVFQSFSKEFDARAIRITLATAHELIDSPRVNSLVISLRKTSDTDRVAASLKSALAPSGLETRTWVELNEFYEKTVALYRQQFGMLQLIILVMVVLSVANSVNMNVFERVGEFGTMRALGNRERDVRRLVLLEGVCLGALGAVVGVALGIVIALGISAVGIPMPPPPNANLGYRAFIRIEPADIVLASAIGFVASVTAVFVPALRVSRIPVVDALRANV